MEAYKFVNVLCFYRVDIKDGQGVDLYLKLTRGGADKILDLI